MLLEPSRSCCGVVVALSRRVGRRSVVGLIGVGLRDCLAPPKGENRPRERNGVARKSQRWALARCTSQVSWAPMNWSSGSVGDCCLISGTLMRLGVLPWFVLRDGVNLTLCQMHVFVFARQVSVLRGRPCWKTSLYVPGWASVMVRRLPLKNLSRFGTWSGKAFRINREPFGVVDFPNWVYFLQCYKHVRK